MPENQSYRILFLVSDPSETGRAYFAKELQQVRDNLASNPHYVLKEQQSVKPENFLKAVSSFKPHIVHFSGHGPITGEICFEGEAGKSLTVSPEILDDFFSKLKGEIKCVILNSCYEESQAGAISRYVPVIIGTKKELGDEASLRFSTGFYAALDAEPAPKNLEIAFEKGRFIVKCYHAIPDKQMLQLITPEKSFTTEVQNAFSSLSAQAINDSVLGLFAMGVNTGLEAPVVNDIIVAQLKKLIKQTKNISQYELKLRNQCKTISLPQAIASLTFLQKGLELSDTDLAAVQKKVRTDLDVGNESAWQEALNNDLANLENALSQLVTTVETKPMAVGAFELVSSRNRMPAEPKRDTTGIFQHQNETAPVMANAMHETATLAISEPNMPVGRVVNQNIAAGGTITTARSLQRNFKSNGESHSDDMSETLPTTEPRRISGAKPKVFFSYAWGTDKEVIVDKLYNSLKADGDYELVRDKVDLGYKGLISQFMKEIGKGSFVVVALSDKYLRSEYCMFELYELYRRSSLEMEELLKKIYPIRVEDLDLNSPKILDDYLTYWTNKESEWRELVKKHAAFQDKYEKVQAIKNSLGELLSFLQDINSLTGELLSQNDFAEIKKAIREKLQEIKD